jgi:hypothetical protein
MSQTNFISNYFEDLGPDLEQFRESDIAGQTPHVIKIVSAIEDLIGRLSRSDLSAFEIIQDPLPEQQSGTVHSTYFHELLNTLSSMEVPREDAQPLLVALYKMQSGASDTLFYGGLRNTLGHSLVVGENRKSGKSILWSTNDPANPADVSIRMSIPRHSRYANEEIFHGSIDKPVMGEWFGIWNKESSGLWLQREMAGSYRVSDIEAVELTMFMTSLIESF